MDRISTGIVGLDNFIEGGVPKGRCVVIRGPSGSGKTIFGLAFLVAGAKSGQKGAYLTLEQSPAEIMLDNLRLMPQMKKFIEEDKLIHIFDRSIKTDILAKPDVKGLFSGHFEGESIKSPKSDREDPRQFDKFIDGMFKQLQGGGYSNLVIDSINALARKNKLMMKALGKPYDEDDHYELVLNLVQRAKSLGLTSYILSEDVGNDALKESHESFVGDCILELQVDEYDNKRLIKIKKIRGTRHVLKPLSFEFRDGEGIVVTSNGQ